MDESLWNKFHNAQESPVLDAGIYSFTVNRIIDLDSRSIMLGFIVEEKNFAQRIYFDSDQCIKARNLLASVGLLKNINDSWMTSELANTVGKKGRCIVGKYNRNGKEDNNIPVFLAPWCDEREQWWRYQVLSRANYICEACGRPGHVAHHKRPKSIYPDEMYTVSNGQCLCKECHDKWHNTYGIMVVGGPGL